MTKDQLEDLGSTIFTELLSRYKLDHLELASILAYTGNFILSTATDDPSLTQSLRDSAKFAYQILTNPTNAALPKQDEAITLQRTNRRSDDSPIIQ